MGHEVLVSSKPTCDFCKGAAAYDAKVPGTGWAYVCEDHFKKFGCKTGTGCGQKLVVKG